MTEMSLEPFVLAFLEKSDRELTLLSSLLSVPSTMRWWSIETDSALFLMNETILEMFFPSLSMNSDTMFLERATPG